MERLFECSICNFTFNEASRTPRLLPTCLHSFCSSCVTRLYQGDNKIACPICRQVNNAPNGNIPVNRDILQFLEAYQLNQQENPAESRPNRDWNEENYLRELFDDIDTNGDNKINTQELHLALRRGQMNSEFDFRTVSILMEKYDTNRDGEISFDEFHNLFFSINNLFNEFLDNDQDYSQTIDPNELKNLLFNKGYQLSPLFFEFLFNGIRLRFNIVSITFDIYVRISARLDFLTRNNNARNFEQFLIQHFFENF